LEESLIPPGAMGMVYLAAVVTAGSFAGLWIALFTAALGFLSWDFFFLPPLHRFTIGSVDDLVALVVFAAVAVLSGSLASRVRAAALSGQVRIESLRRIAQFSRRLGEPVTEPEMMAEIARQAAGILGRGIVLAREGEDLFIRGAEPPADTLDEASWAAARWCAAHNEPAGRGTATLPSAAWRFLPMRTVRGQWGVLGARAVPDRPLDATTVQTLSALADQAGTALERVRLANEAARSAAMDETQKLRTALLNSLSHDLRTPLTGIRGAAETLLINGDSMKPPDRRDLLESIQEDTGRMTKFLSNIMDLTRLESGAIQPRLAPTPLPELIDAAAARVPHLDTLAIDLTPNLPPALADAALLEQVLVNVLDNAHRYAPAGSLIRVSARASLGRITIEVADEGVGIPAADLPHVFDSFYRARRGDRVAPGTGLGLAIARGLMTAMGGTIEAISPRPDAARDGSPGTLIQMTIGAA
jgi:two-component system sensor histidine kinase KdpD